MKFEHNDSMSSSLQYSLMQYKNMYLQAIELELYAKNENNKAKCGALFHQYCEQNQKLQNLDKADSIPL